MRQAGILMGISSLPGRHGIGDFGSSAYEFVDHLASTKSKIWQILPFNRLGYANSPYQAYSSIAGDEIFISLDEVAKEGLLKAAELPNFNEQAATVDYDAVRAFKDAYLHKAFGQFKQDSKKWQADYDHFVKTNSWVHNYSVFVAIKKANDLRCWLEWPEEHKLWIKNKQLDLTPFADEIAYQTFLQFIFYRQWQALKAYANQLGIEIMGDIPYYVGIDSIDVWSNQEQFLLDDRGYPTYVAGVPPDYFAVTGQRWGNPIYNWDLMVQDNFAFWINRLQVNSHVFDIIRIDHFRAFDTYWKIPSSCPTAMEGEWIEAPGYAFFDQLFKVMPNIRVVAEDLGEMRPQVGELRDHYKFTGMKILQFTFDPREENNNFVDRENMIIYSGTHDNQTVMGWYSAQDHGTQEAMMRYLTDKGYKGSPVEALVAFSIDSIAYLAIVPVQDMLGLDDHARMNEPGTVGSPNWEWKLVDFNAFKEVLPHFRHLVEASGRVG